MSEEKTRQLMNEEEYGYITLADRIFNPSTIVSIIACVLMIFGLTMPIIDFSVFHKSVDIQYNLIKVCENVRILSPIWNGIPYGIIVGIVILFILSFVNIPPLKIIPCVLIIVMYIIILADVGNIIEWGNEIIDKFLSKNDIVISKTSIVDGLMYGLYFTIAGIVLALVSCFLPGAKLRKE